MQARAGVVVLLLLLVIGGGLLVVEVRKSQEAAARAQCNGHLCFLSISVHHYHDVHKKLPAAAVPNPNLPLGKRLSWIVALSPYLEIGSPKVDNDRAWDDPENRVIWAHGMDASKWVVRELRFLICPANPIRNAAGLPGVTHYVGITGVGADAVSLPVGDRRCGVFGYDRTLTLKDITDGTSDTMLIAETMRDNGPWTAGGRATARGLAQDGSPYVGDGGQFGSTHGDGANVAFADGSRRFLRSTISPAVFEALATVAGREKITPADLD